jgi:putative PIN family toxin of toxin-antitoxin system
MNVVAPKVVIDTNVLTGALLRRAGDNRAVLRACLEGRLEPVVGQALLHEYEDVLGRSALFTKSPLTAPERQQFLEAFLSVCNWVRIFYRWRPNLKDEGDNHLIELAVAGGASAIVTHNRRDLRGGELRFPGIRILTPSQILKELA